MERRAGGRKRINYESLIGSKFNMLTIIDIAREPKKRTSAKCICDCGNNWTGAAEWVVSGNTTSCGCHKRKVLLDASTSHGLTRHALYPRWVEMIGRCHSDKDHAFPYYGGRGIAVCDRWRVGEGENHPFVLFLNDMLPTWTAGLTIDRIDNNSGYSPDNCRWANRRQQSWNRRNVALIHVDGESIPLAEYCRRSGKHRSTIIRRMRRLGLTLNEAALMS